MHCREHQLLLLRLKTTPADRRLASQSTSPVDHSGFKYRTTNFIVLNQTPSTGVSSKGERHGPLTTQSRTIYDCPDDCRAAAAFIPFYRISSGNGTKWRSE